MVSMDPGSIAFSELPKAKEGVGICQWYPPLATGEDTSVLPSVSDLTDLMGFSPYFQGMVKVEIQ